MNKKRKLCIIKMILIKDAAESASLAVPGLQILRGSEPRKMKVTG